LTIITKEKNEYIVNLNRQARPTQGTTGKLKSSQTTTRMPTTTLLLSIVTHITYKNFHVYPK
jgi:hypothetical protein